MYQYVAKTLQHKYQILRVRTFNNRALKTLLQLHPLYIKTSVTEIMDFPFSDNKKWQLQMAKQIKVCICFVLLSYAMDRFQ